MDEGPPEPESPAPLAAVESEMPTPEAFEKAFERALVALKDMLSIYSRVYAAADSALATLDKVRSVIGRMSEGGPRDGKTDNPEL